MSTDGTGESTAKTLTLNRQILRLSLPALGALVAEPLFLLTNTAMVGHLGVESLAALGIASALLQTAIGLMIFLAYSTTPQVARRVGAGDTPGAVQAGIGGIWLALALGLILIVIGWLLAGPVVAAFGADAAVRGAAERYWQLSLWGIPAMLGVLAASGILRGLQNTIVPLWIAGIGFAVNAAMNAALIYGAGLGLDGSALGTVATQWLMFAAYLAVLVRIARQNHASWFPQLGGIIRTAGLGGWLFLRTLALRIATLLPLVVVSAMGTTELAGYQLISTLFTAAAFALESLEIAGQALTGKALGVGDTSEVRLLLARLLRWGCAFGALLGALVLVLSPWLGTWLSGSSVLGELLKPALAVLALAMPLGGLAFMLDGVLIGAGDARFLALAGVANLAILATLIWLVSLSGQGGASGLAWLTAAYFIGYILARFVTLFARSRGTKWMHLH